MKDVRFVSGDSESLILETHDGEKLRLTLEESVLSAIRKSPQGSNANNLSPREIQDSIRGGASIEELASSSGDSIDYIRRFAAPVVEELEHMVSSALAVRVEISPDRFNEVRHQEFGEFVAERLTNLSARNLSWQARRQSPSTWMVSVTFDTPSGTGFASWTYEPRHVLLSPENETAINITNSSPLGDSLIPKLSSVSTDAAPAVKATSEESNAPVTDLLDAFKQRREAAAKTEIETETSTEIQAKEVKPVPEAEKADETPAPETPKKGRAPMPSWDEIVFGSKSED